MPRQSKDSATGEPVLIHIEKMVGDACAANGGYPRREAIGVGSSLHSTIQSASALARPEGISLSRLDSG